MHKHNLSPIFTVRFARQGEMGIHANWKVLLKENYEHCFLSQIDDLDEQLDVLIIDFLPFIFGKSKNIKTGEHFLNYVFKVPSSFACLPLLHRACLALATDRHAQIIRNFFDKGGHTCVIAIDTLKYVPLAKGTPSPRTQGRTCVPFTCKCLTCLHQSADADGPRQVQQAAVQGRAGPR